MNTHEHTHTHTWCLRCPVASDGGRQSDVATTLTGAGLALAVWAPDWPHVAGGAVRWAVQGGRVHPAHRMGLHQKVEQRSHARPLGRRHPHPRPSYFLRTHTFSSRTHTLFSRTAQVEAGGASRVYSIPYSEHSSFTQLSDF
eukprot:8195885-Pyramimonas_sp.AAC.2